MIAGAVVLAAESRLMREDLGRFASASPNAWWALLYLAVFGSLVGFTAFAFCLNELPAATVGTYAYVNPVVAVVLGSVFLGEPVSAGLVAGAVLILGAVLLTTTRRRVPPPPREAPPTVARSPKRPHGRSSSARETTSATPEGSTPVAVSVRSSASAPAAIPAQRMASAWVLAQRVKVTVSLSVPTDSARWRS